MTSQSGNSLLQDGQVFSLQNALIYCNPTEVKMSQMVLPCHANHQGELSMGQLLKWIDTTACLSAEKHAGCSCVTASMDDIHIEHTISVGHVVNIKAKVNRAFNSSMEVGIQVSCENLFQGKEWNVCKAFATFVASKQGTEKIRLKPFEPYTQEEQVEYSIAAERRRMRLAHAETIKALLLKSAVQEECNQSETVNVVPAEKTRVESVELVLPPHANHQGYTFGGQIMAWMENVATIAASRLCNSYATLRTIDMFHFRGPSQVGDRLVLKAIVNSAFKNSMEVGVCAHAYREGSEDSLRHLNSAFMTFIVLDKEGQPITLPQIKPEPGDGVRRYNEANARKKLRLDRKYIISCKQTEVPLSVPWDPCNQVYLSYNNVSALKMLAAKRNWVLDSEKNKVKLSTLEDGQFLSFKIEMEVPLEASTIFLILSDLTRRTEWDPHYQKCEVIQKVNDDDTIYHLITPSVKEGSKFQDFVLLASRRKPCAAGDPFVIAFRSVTLPTHLATSEYTRGEVQCAGFSILQQGDSQTKVTYYNQASPEVLPYITTDIAGLSSGYYTTFESCLKYIERNKNNITLFMQEHKL